MEVSNYFYLKMKPEAHWDTPVCPARLTGTRCPHTSEHSPCADPGKAMPFTAGGTATAAALGAGTALGWDFSPWQAL